jgi:iron complex outermembrane receptor protein
MRPAHRPSTLHRLGIGLIAVVGSITNAWAAGAEPVLLSLDQLLEVPVVGASKYEQRQSEVGAAVSVITRREIRAFGWRTLGDALASLPGVHTTYDRQYHYIGARGFGLPGDFNTRMLVTINGNRVNDVTFDSGPTGRHFPLDMDLVERIEFIPGPGGAVYGQNAMFGVVNVVTRTGADLDGAELSAIWQQPQRQREGRLTWGRRFDNGLDVVLSGSGLRSRGQDRWLDFGASGISGLAIGQDGERDEEFHAHAAQGVWSFDTVHGRRSKQDPTGAYLSDPLVQGQFESDRHDLSQWVYQDSFRQGTLQLMGRLYTGQEHYDSRLIYGTTFTFPAFSRWHGTEVRLLSTALTDHKLMLGAEYQDNERVQQKILDQTDAANDIAITGSGHRVGLYVQDEWRMGETLTTTLGLRLDRSSLMAIQRSPRVALIWKPVPSTTIKTLYGRAHRAPNAYERDYDDGFAQIANPALRGETIDTLEIVTDHRIDSNLQVRGSVYQWTMRNLITLGIDPASGRTQYQSGATVKTDGIELSADKTWSWGARLRGSAAWQQARTATSSTPVNSPRTLLKLNYSAPLPVAGLRVGYEFAYDGRRRTLNGGDLGGYALSNLQLGADRWVQGLDLMLNIRNLFDKHYAHPAADSNWQNALEQDGRSVQIRLNYLF